MKTKNEIKVLALFSQPIGIFNLKINHKKIHNFLKNKIKYRKLINPDQLSPFASVENKLFNIHKELKELKKECENNLNIYLKEILKYDFKFKIINSWATKTPIKHYSHSHFHPHTFLSCVYYPSYSEHFKITFEKNDGIDTFFDLNPIEYNLLNTKKWTITPELGSLLIFPSTLKHKIDQNNGNEDRFSLAFCVNPIGKFAVGRDNEIEFK